MGAFIRRPVIYLLIAGAACYGVYWLLDSRSYWRYEAGRWQDSTVVYQYHTKRLRGDSTVFRGLIADLQTQATNAQANTDRYQNQYARAVAESDRNADRLTARERDMAYLNALIKNKTLHPADTIYRDRIVTAGLKTAGRESIGAETIDSLTKSIGYIKEQNDRQGATIDVAKQKVRRIKADIALRKKGGVWPFNQKRQKQLDATQADVSELENLLNQ